jgi:hypothetical protein
MRHSATLMAAVVAVTTGGRATAADGDEKAREVIDRAIQAQAGSSAKLEKLKHVSLTAKGTLNTVKGPVPTTRESHLALPGKGRWVLELGGDNPIKAVFVLAGDQGWQLSQGTTEPMPREFLAEMQDEAYALSLARLPALLTAKGMTLAALPEAKVNGRPAVGVKASQKGRPDVELYFDAQTRLLVKLAYQGKLAGQAVLKETEFAQHKDVDGIQMPTKLVERVGGKVVAEWADVRYSFPEKFPDDTFVKP